MKRKLSFIVLIFMAVFWGCCQKTSAAVLKEPAKLQFRTRVYYEYLEKHHIPGGDCYSLRVNWSKIKGAQGYQLKLYWESDDEEGTYIQIIDVKKQKNGYLFTSKHRYPNLYRTAKDLVTKSPKKRIFSKKLQVFVCGGSTEDIAQLSVRGYKMSGSKKKYGRALSADLSIYRNENDPITVSVTPGIKRMNALGKEFNNLAGYEFCENLRIGDSQQYDFSKEADRKYAVRMADRKMNAAQQNLFSKGLFGKGVSKVKQLMGEWGESYPSMHAVSLKKTSGKKYLAEFELWFHGDGVTKLGNVTLLLSKNSKAKYGYYVEIMLLNMTNYF